MSKPTYGVVQRSESRDTADKLSSIPWTEWLSSKDPVDWTRNPAEAFVFCGTIGKTGAEVAEEFAKALNAAGDTTKHHAVIRSAAGQRPAHEPPMPAMPRVVDRRFHASREDWHARAVNCGVE